MNDTPSSRLRLVREIEEFCSPPLSKCLAIPLTAKALRDAQRNAAIADLHELVRATCRHLIRTGQFSQAKLALAMGCTSPFLFDVLHQHRQVQPWMIMLLPHEGKVELARRLSQITTPQSETGT